MKFLDVSHSKRDWIERKTWKVVWRQGQNTDDDSNNQVTSNRWNQQQTDGWNRDNSVSEVTDWNSNGFSGWNNNNNVGGWNNNNNLDSKWNTNSVVNRWNSNSINRGWNMNNFGNEWTNRNFNNQWNSVNRGNSWNNNIGSNDQIPPIRPLTSGKIFRRVETLKIEQ